MRRIQSSFLLFTFVLVFPFIAISQQINSEEYSNLEILDHPQSLEKLLNKFEGRVVYIDLMASWCVPCIAELKESKKLEPYFAENNIVKLYITIDSKEEIEKAIKMIQRETLSGYFASYHPKTEMIKKNNFGREIQTLFLTDEKGNMDISIPKYAIVNKKGEIVVKRAEKPSNADLLKKQLEEYL